MLQWELKHLTTTSRDLFFSSFTEDELSAFFGTVSLFARLFPQTNPASAPKREVLAVYQRYEDLPSVIARQCDPTPMHAELMGAILVTIDIPPVGSTQPFQAVLIGAAVDDDIRRNGLGNALYMEMHWRVFEICQRHIRCHNCDENNSQKQWKQWKAGLDTLGCSPHSSTRLMSFTHQTLGRLSLEYQLGPGSCRRNSAILEWLGQFKWVKDAAPAPASLVQPYQDPMFVQRETPFLPHSMWSPLPVGGLENPEWEQTYRQNLQLVKAPQYIIPGGSLTHHIEGVSNFSIPAQCCRQVEEFISGKHNWTKELHPSLMYQSGKLMGNLEYDNHNGSLTIQNTPYRAITNSAEQAVEVLGAIPGLADVASFALFSMGLPDFMIKSALEHIFCINLFPIDKEQQSSYKWHSDDRDLCKLGGNIYAKQATPPPTTPPPATRADPLSAAPPPWHSVSPGHLLRRGVSGG